MSHSVSHASIFGVVTGFISTFIPDGIATYAEKLLLAAPIAFVTGFAYYFGGLLAAKIRARFDKKPQPEVVITEKEEP